MLTIDIDGNREVKHDFTRIAPIYLQQIRLGIAADSASNPVTEDALGAIADQIALRISGQRLAEAIIVGGHVAILIGADRIGVASRMII